MTNRGADFELQVAIVAALGASAAVQALLGNPARAYQEVPAPVNLPYIYVGDSQVLPDRAECIDGEEIFVDIHAYSEEKGFSEIKRLGAAIIKVLNDASLAITEHRCMDLYLSRQSTFKDGNLTKHSILTFRATVEPTV